MDQETINQLVSLPTIDRYKELARSRNEPEVIEQLPNGGSLGWFGSKLATKVVGYVHGGGLVLNAMLVQLELAHDVYKLIQKHDPDTALAILAYDTCATAPYPTQITQTVSFVDRLLKDRTPENIRLYGDSAGGALILALLLHQHRPHPKVPPFSLPAGHLLGPVLLLSPSGPVVTSAPSMATNSGKDIATPEILSNMWATITMNHDKDIDLVNPWLTPALALDEECYTALAVGNITVVVGDREILRDDIVKVANAIKERHQGGAVDVKLIPEAVHCSFMVERLMNLPPSPYTLTVNEWAEQ